MTDEKFTVPALNAEPGRYYYSTGEAQEAGVFDCDEFLDWVVELGLDGDLSEEELDRGVQYVEAKAIWCDHQTSRNTGETK